MSTESYEGAGYITDHLDEIGFIILHLRVAGELPDNVHGQLLRVLEDLIEALSRADPLA